MRISDWSSDVCSSDLDGTIWRQVDPGAVASQAGRVYESVMRVTSIIQQSTDLFVPLGCVLGAWLILLGRRRSEMVGGAALIIISAAAVTLTYTRSMLMSAVMVLGLMILFGIYRGVWRRALCVFLLMSITVACVIVLVGLEDVYLHRFSQLKQAVSSGLVEAYRSVGNVASSTDVNKTGINDVNVTSRLEEYAIAWHKFRS